MLHGIFDTGRLFKHMALYLEDRGWETHCLNLAPNSGRTGLENLAAQVGTYVEQHFRDDESFHVVGFSMGGLVARYYVERLAPRGRVRQLVTISSPHRGTRTAYLVWNKGTIQMRPGSRFLVDLENCLGGCLGFTSIWTPLDLMIIPANSSVIPGARVERIRVAYHGRMVRDPRVMRAVERALTAGYRADNQKRL